VKRKSAGFVLAMNYGKPPLQYEEQYSLLERRGLTVANRARALEWLRRIGYYRLSGYFLPFKVAGADLFVPGSTFESIVDLYKFDCHLRLLVMQALDRIEIAVRAVVTFHLAHELGVFGHVDRTNFSPEFDHQQFMQALANEEKRSSEVFIVHYRDKYAEENNLPIWMATELISFGALSKMYEHLRKSLRKKIAGEFELPQSVFGSWLHALTAVRNVCAHHNRLWDRELSIKPELPSHWRHTSIRTERFYCIALILQYLVARTAPKSNWKSRLSSHVRSRPSIDLVVMQFPLDWQEIAPWN
jgi:abortive infection bacteriophage resistance protein